jgi:hypothetical protein
MSGSIQGRRTVGCVSSWAISISFRMRWRDDLSKMLAKLGFDFRDNAFMVGFR